MHTYPCYGRCKNLLEQHFSWQTDSCYSAEPASTVAHHKFKIDPGKFSHLHFIRV
jgi:hypothetical protein